MAQPEPAVAAAALMTQLAQPLQNNRARRERQEKRDKPPPASLENTVLKNLNQHTHLYLNLKRFFNKLPAAILELINQSGLLWRCLPMVGLLATPRCQNLKVEFFGHPMGENLHCTLQELDQLCDSIAENCQDSLQRLEILQSSLFHPREEEAETRLGLSVSQLGPMLLQLRALTSFTLECDSCTSRDTNMLVSVLATSNPHIRSLKLPSLSAKSLATISRRWPELKHLVCNSEVEIPAAEIAAALSKLRRLHTFQIPDQSAAMLEVTRAPDPGTWPLEGSFQTPDTPFSGRDMSGIFSCFPCLEELSMVEDGIPQVVEGLGGRKTKIATLLVECTTGNPLALRPLLDTPMGRNLTNITIRDKVNPVTRVNLALIGHCCKLLKNLNVEGDIMLIASPDFKVDSTYFCNLTQCKLHHNIRRHGPADLPDALVCCLLAGPGLVKCYLEGVPISEAVASSLAEESGEGGALSSLTEMIIWYGDVSARAVAIISSRAPRLRRVVYGQPRQEPRYKRDVIAEFFKQSKLPVALKLYP